MWGSGAAFSLREGALPFGACGAKARPAGGAAALPPQQRPGYRIRLLPGAPRPRPRFSACRSRHGPGRKRRHAIEPGRSVYGSLGRTACPKARLRGIPRRVPAAKPPERAPPCTVYGLGCGSGGLRLQIKKPPTGALYASIATGSAWVRNAMHPPK